MGSKPNLSIVIASVGRPGLTQILKDIHDSCRENPLRIILVLDGVDQTNAYINIWEQFCWKVINTQKRVGPSIAYSLGLRAVDTKYFRIFTDDDQWDGKAFREVIQNLESNSVLICKTNIQDELGRSTRQSYFPEDSSPLKSVYGPIIPWKRNDVYFHLTSIIFPLEASKISFDEGLIIREDLDWLQRVYESGIKFNFSDVILGTVFPSHLRSAERQSVQIDIDWTKRLSLKSKKLSRNFVYFHCFRSFAVNGEPLEILKRYYPLREIVGKPTIHEFLACIFYLNLSFIRKIQRALGG